MTGSDEVNTEVKTLRVTWESTHQLRVPVGTACPQTLDELMELVRADPDLADIESSPSELLDWIW